MLDYGDGWMPRAVVPEELAGQIAELERRAEAPVPVTVFGARPEREVVEAYADLGIDRLIFNLPTLPASQTLQNLDQMAELIEAG